MAQGNPRADSGASTQSMSGVSLASGSRSPPSTMRSLKREAWERVNAEAPELVAGMDSILATFGLVRFPEARIFLGGKRVWPPADIRRT